MYEFPHDDRFRKLLFFYPGKAIQFLYEYHYQILLKTSVKLTRDHKASEDILQDVFFHVWLKHEVLSRDHSSPITHYLMKVVQNMSITFYRKEQRIREWKINCIRERGDAFQQSEEDRIIHHDIMEHVKKIIAEFPLREQQCYLWSREEELTNKQIAERLKVSEKAVERSITSARKRLRMQLRFNS